MLARLAPGIEPEANVREDVIRAVRTLRDPRAVPALVAAAAKEEEPDLAVTMSVAAFELGGAGQDADLKKAADVLVTRPRGRWRTTWRPARRTRGAPRACRARCAAGDGAAIAAWWQPTAEALVWHAADHRLAPAG